MGQGLLYCGLTCINFKAQGQLYVLGSMKKLFLCFSVPFTSDSFHLVEKLSSQLVLIPYFAMFLSEVTQLLNMPLEESYQRRPTFTALEFWCLRSSVAGKIQIFLYHPKCNIFQNMYYLSPFSTSFLFTYPFTPRMKM